MDVKQINQLMVSMGKTGIKRLVIKKQEFELELEREDKAPQLAFQDNFSDISPENPLRSDFERHKYLSLVRKDNQNFSDEKCDNKEEEECVYVTSPIIGTVYKKPTPKDPPFVQVGDIVEAGDVVCIVEAMKVMNEVKAGVAGQIAEILIEESHPVEYGTKLFKIIPKG